MTVVVGALCADGVVIGSDSAATITAEAERRATIQQPSQKVFVLEGVTVVASSGSGGLGQRVNDVVERYWEGGENRDKDHLTIAKDIAVRTQNDWQQTRIALPAPITSLMAFVTNRKFYLCEMQFGTFQPEFRTRELWHASVGSGQILCDPFLGFMRRVFWENQQPNLSEGIFAVTWALQHAISLNTGGIAGPMQIATLTLSRGTRPVARRMNEDELESHKANAKQVELYLSNYWQARDAGVRQTMPPLPRV